MHSSQPANDCFVLKLTILSKCPFLLPSWFIYSLTLIRFTHSLSLYFDPKFTLQKVEHRSLSKPMRWKNKLVPILKCHTLDGAYAVLWENKKLKGIESGTDPCCNMKYVKKGKMVWWSARRKTALNQTWAHENTDWRACAAGCMYASVCAGALCGRDIQRRSFAVRPSRRVRLPNWFITSTRRTAGVLAVGANLIPDGYPSTS